MDNRNVFVAIALSMSVLLFWGAFFDAPKQQRNVVSQKQERNLNSSTNQITPDINQFKTETTLSRKDAITQNDRVIIKNDNVEGSISLKGAVIDDLSFIKYKKELKNEDKVVFLNPKEIADGYYVETGWSSIGNKVKVPNIETQWSVKGNKLLNQNNSVTLVWNNGEGIIFKKIVSLDDKFLFKIKQEVQNNTKEDLELYPYAQITRNKKPDDVQGFYILHEGFIGVFDGELKEDGYDDIKEKRYQEMLIMDG